MCPNIVTLFLDTSSITDSSIKCICEFTQLERLQFENTDLSGEKLMPLTSLNDLKELIVAGSDEITVSDYLQLEARVGLRERGMAKRDYRSGGWQGPYRVDGLEW
jgi:hypothetical protein